MKWLIHIHSDVFKETLSTNSVDVLVFKRSMWPLKNAHVFVGRMTLCVFRRPRWKTSAYSVARGTGTGWRLLFMRVFPSAGLLEWWRQWWSSLFYRRQPKSIQQQRVNHSRRPSFITAERSGLIFKWKHFSTDMKSFFFYSIFDACVQHSSSLVCGIMGECFETDSIDCRLLSFRRSSAVRSAAWYDFNQQIE